MQALICPQCGGRITEYLPGSTFTTCSYCSTKFLIDDAKEEHPLPAYTPPSVSGTNSRVIAGVVLAVLFVFAGVFLVAMVSDMKRGKYPPPAGPGRTFSPPAVSRATGTTAPTPNPDLLEFGAKGIDNGFFKDANSIAVDKQNRIYVGDDSLRVQQFDDKGNYVRTWQMPRKTINYDRAFTIGKIAVADGGKLYAEVGGTVQVYNERSPTAVQTIEVAPDFIEDFALKADGGLLAVSHDDNIETLLFVNKGGRLTKRIKGFHTDALDSPISPQSTAIGSIRVAVDTVGNIFSVYALGDLGSYSISSNNDELLIARFTPEGKFLSKSIQSMDSCGIEIDNKGRIYVSNQRDLINIYSNTGEMVDAVVGLDGLRAFALDKDNNVYALLEDRVVKRPAIR